MKGSTHFIRDRWFVQVYWEGQRYQIYRYNDDPIWHEKTAKKLLSKIQAEIDDGIFEPRAYFPDSPLSVREYSERWLTLIDVKPNTLKDYRYSVKRFIAPFFERKDLRKIRHMDLIEFYKSINRCEKGKYNVMSCLRTMMRWAWRNEDIQKVPPFPALSQGALPEIEYSDNGATGKGIGGYTRESQAYFPDRYGIRAEDRGNEGDYVGLYH